PYTTLFRSLTFMDRGKEVSNKRFGNFIGPGLAAIKPYGRHGGAGFITLQPIRHQIRITNRHIIIFAPISFRPKLFLILVTRYQYAFTLNQVLFSATILITC